ncbi:MAG: hypothetical protein ACOYBW_05610 [Fluviibacter phosphoraccumulans]
MTKAPAYACFLYLISEIKKEAADSAFDGCDEVLAYMAVKEAEGQSVTITELVQSLQFGTGPTVQRRISLLLDRGLIKAVQRKSDARVKDLCLTPKAMKHLEERSSLLKHCFEA